MAERTRYAPGTFSWTDLTTTDLDAAKQFYGRLFGWTAVDLPAGDEIVYVMMHLDGKKVAGIAPQSERQRAAGAPPAWNAYITVETADAEADRAKKLGANVIAPAFDVMGVGRMAAIQDPQGAFLLLWEAKTHIGADVVNAPGALVWNELATPDLDGSAGFYREMFGWQVEPIEGMQMPYMMIQTAEGNQNGGMRPSIGAEPTYWLTYFGTADIDATVGGASELGGNTLVDVTDIGMGNIAVLQDPQGAVFALFSGHFDD